ncbi:PKD domain-containing protein [Mucilaginibacter ximonensis]|uniref:PKD domain-containing protein n=1 Tax=Mucilaginibacter ximonensis TaxID=538021 RepID=A0ABW5Y7M5_9SPHI
MKRTFYKAVIPLLLIISVTARAQTNKGTEFWTAFMSHNAGVDDPDKGASMILYITSDISTTGSVEIGGSLLQNFSVTANQVTFIPIPASAFLQSSGTFPAGGIHITSAKPIAVYAHIYAANVSGATLLLPVSAMGKEYMSLNYTQRSNADSVKNPAYSQFAVIATEDNTTVSITPTADLLDGHSANTSFNLTLNKGVVYQGLSKIDLTGTKIQSISNSAGTCKKIAVFSGSTRMAIYCQSNVKSPSSDNLFQQVYPTSTWGKNYIAVPLRSRFYDVYRIVLSDPNTNVTLNGTTLNPASLVNGLYYQFQSTQVNVISADKPVQVVQYSPTQSQRIDCTSSTGDIGDPEMIYLSPIEQGLTHVTLYATGYYKIINSYINVVIPTAAVQSFKLDGVNYASSFVPLSNTSPYSFAQISVSSGPQAISNSGASVTSGTHTLDASVPFNAVVYGFGNTESYGYAAGTNLADLNEHVTLTNANTPTVIQTSGCSNAIYKAQVTIPFQTTNIAWKIDSAVFTDNNPQVKSTLVKDDKTLYTYEYNAPVSLKAGNHTIIATVFNPVADVCGSSQDVENDFSITDPPPVAFTAPATDCYGDSTAFKDNTVPASGETIKSWLWDFGDNTTSSLQNPLHKYAAPGNYDVRLTETDNNGCSTVSAPKTVHIIARPIAGFNSSSPDCAGQTITFTNTSSAPEGTIVKWAWNFGDGTVINAANGQKQIHTYTTTGDYTVKLAVTTADGCTSDTLTNVITIHPLPVVDFVVPDVCLGDVITNYINNSSIADHTESEFTYLWDFGDPNSTPANNQSTLKNPQHIYTAVGPYTVKLTVTSKYGCSSTAQKTFTVNGSHPTAKFAVENSCSSDDIVFDDLSSVDAYYVTKIVWCFDYHEGSAANVYETYADSTLHANKKYTHHYPLFNTPAQQSYVVKMVVYSGQTCKDSVVQTININANPVIALSANGKNINTTSVQADVVIMCQGDAPLQVVEDKGVYAGLGKFSGQGISASGLIDPKQAGVGSHTINYLFTAASTGCTYAASFVLNVNPQADVSLPQRFNVLEGNQVTLRASASITGGGNLTYKWTPSTGLSADNVSAPVATLSNDITYTLTVTSDKGCAVTAQTFVKVLKIPVIPNTFTPNGDGINDTWVIKYLNDYPNATVEIFNRYGGRVFYSNGYGIPWDGRQNGTDLPVGTYYYIISPNSGRKPTSGFLTIIR